MCIVSAIYPLYEGKSKEWWSYERMMDYTRIMEQAEKIDKDMGLDNCPDTMKKNKLLEELKERFGVGRIT